MGMIFRQCTKTSQNDLGIFKVKLSIWIPHTPQRPKFSIVGLYDELVSSYSPKFWEMCTKWPQNNLDMFKVKGTHMNTIYTRTPISLSISHWAIFKLWPNIQKSALNDSKMTLAHSRSKLPMMAPEAQVHSSCSTMSSFWDTTLFRKSWLNDPKITLRHVQGQKYPYAFHINPWGP